MPEYAAESDRLDREFDRSLAAMKQHVLDLPLRADKQKCALWIKKLCEAPTPQLTGRTIRNAYTHLMHKMLERGSLHGPFLHKPPSGPLEPLSTQLLGDYGEKVKDSSQEVQSLPSWISSDLLDSTRLTNSSTRPSSMAPRSPRLASSMHATDEESKNTTGWSTVNDTTDASSLVVPNFRERLGLPQRRRAYTSLGIPLNKSPNHRPIETQSSPNRSLVTSDDIDIGTRRSEGHSVTFLPGLDHTRSDKDGGPKETAPLSRLPGHEYEMKIKTMEAKFQEERLVQQQRHDAEVEKVLQRKNTELDEMKTHYHQKVKDADVHVAKMEHKMQHMQKDHEGACADKDKKYAELKSICERAEDSAKKKFEEKLHESLAEFEQDKYEMQKLHTKNIQEILSDTNSRLEKMEAQYAQQITNTAEVMSELEQRVQEVTGEAATTAASMALLEKVKVDLEAQIERDRVEMDDLKLRHRALQQQHEQTMKDHDTRLTQTQQKYENEAAYQQKEHDAQIHAATEKLASQTAAIDRLKLSLKEAEQQRVHQLKELLDAGQKDKQYQQSIHDKQVSTVRSEMELKAQELANKIKKLTQQLKDKDVVIGKLRDEKGQITTQADKALADFKLQVEKNQARIYEDMRLNMSKIEGDLDKSRQMRERQSKEFIKQRDDERDRHDTELREAREEFASERSKLLHEQQTSKEREKVKVEGEMEALRASLEQQIQRVTSQAAEKSDRQSRTITQLEAKVTEVREELVAAHQTRKQQLVELGLARDQEKQTLVREHEAQLNKIQATIDQQRISMQKSHALEMDEQLQKTNSRLADMEAVFADKAQKYTDTIQKLQFSLQDLHTQVQKQKELGENNLVNLRMKFEEDKKLLQKKYSQSIKTLKHDLDSQRNLLRSTQNKLEQQSVEQAELTTKLKLENEERLHGFVPSSIQKDYEETIRSLKSQVATLQQTVKLLQADPASTFISPTIISDSPPKSLQKNPVKSK